jgi:peroxiredoxin
MVVPYPALWLVAAALVVSACAKDSSTQPTPELAAAPALGAQQPTKLELVTQKAPPPRPTAAAEVGKPAPAFALKDLDGKLVQLEQFRGKKVVLEWFNPECPFVKKAHRAGSLKGTAAKHATAGVVWLAINSGATGKQGHSIEANAAGVEQFGMSYPVLLDEDGSVGRAYGAERTPHMFVIDEEGLLIYKGAIDNSPDGEGASPKGGTLVRYVDRALESATAGEPVDDAETEPYGCSVKYAN